MERRDFLKKTLFYSSCSALGATAFLKTNRALLGHRSQPKIPKVIRAPLMHHSAEEAPHIGIYLDALDRGVEILTGEQGLSAYKKLFPQGKVAIKVNCASLLSPQLSLIDALLKRLSDVQIKRVVVWDRFDSDLTTNGYPLRKIGNFKFLGTNALPIAYPKQLERFPLEWKVSGSPINDPKQIWETSFSNILWEQTDHLINVAVLKDHARCGVSLTMKNAYGMIHNPHKLHGHGCNPYLTELNKHPLLRLKTKLCLIDGHRGQYQGGPKWDSQHLFFPQCLYLSQSSLAIDLEGWSVIDKERKRLGFPSLEEEKRSPLYLQNSIPPHWPGYELIEAMYS